MKTSPTDQAPADSYEATERTALGRFAFRGRFDRATVYPILDEAFLCHVGYVRDGQPFVTPTSFWRVGDVLYWHGSAESSMLRSVSVGIPVCFTVSHVDGIVLSRVMSRHSFNYRSVVVLGIAQAVRDPEEKMRGMRAFVDRLLPGRWSDGVQQVLPAEIERITIVRMDLQEASAKVRSGPPKDSELLFDRIDAWAGYVPFKTAIGKPVPDSHLKAGVPAPEYLATLARRFNAFDATHVELDMPVFTSVPATEALQSSRASEVEVMDTGETFPVAPAETILSAALRSGVALRYGCAAGGCGACKVRMVKGTVQMGAYEQAALPEIERNAGWVLSCCARPLENCGIVVPRPASAAEGPVTATVAQLKKLTHDIMGVWLLPSGVGNFNFQPGQFVKLKFGGLPEREYSIASQPGDPQLEFHIRAAPLGYVSRHVFSALRVGDGVGVSEPYGVAVHHDDERRVVAMAGGSGLAPIKSIIERRLKLRPSALISLYFGVRSERDLYALDELALLAELHPGFCFTPVLSAPEAATWRRRGFVADALREDSVDLTDARIYIAGPPVMVDSCTVAAIELGAAPERIHADAFLSSEDKQQRVAAFIS